MLIGFIIGLLIGGFLGVSVMALLSIAKEADQRTEIAKKKGGGEKMKDEKLVKAIRELEEDLDCFNREIEGLRTLNRKILMIIDPPQVDKLERLSKYWDGVFSMLEDTMHSKREKGEENGQH